MADPLLTSLCSICHVSPPKYKCPRCGFRTCSLACTKKHRSWSECSGERDPTKYVPKAKLRTAAGVDHDYNFLYGLERSVERGEKVVVGERGLVREDELRPLTVQEVRWKHPPGGRRGGRPRRVVVTRALRETGGRVFERLLAQRLARLNVRILCAPTGMARQKENNTTLNRRTGRVNWQVEWLAFGAGGRTADEGMPRTMRALSKVMDDVPLYRAYHGLLEEQAKSGDRPPKKTTQARPWGMAQDFSTSTWYATASTLQDPFTATWAPCRTPFDLWPSQEDEALRRHSQYFLARPYSRSDMPVTITKLEPTDCLRDILTNTRVLEFPTIYVLRDGEALPGGFVLGPKDSIPPQGQKRKGAPGSQTSRFAKRGRHGGKDRDDGEIGSGDEGNSDAGEGGESKSSVGLEPGEVIDEQSFGEEDDDEDDDSTSSSGMSSDPE